MSEDEIVPDDEWGTRVLCSDENCIGVIGANGCCKECGRPYDGPLPEVTIEDHFESAASSETDLPGPDEDSASETGTDDSINAEDDEWESRTLCRDEACIGVIGSDGRCKECGLEY